MKLVPEAVVLLFLKVYSSDAGTATIGATTNLECPLSLIAYYWYKKFIGGTKLLNNGDKYYGALNETLTINNVELADEGFYRCEGFATGGDYSMSHLIELSVTVDGGWSTWNTWEACTTTCGTGQHRRRRHCNNPTPANGGASCQGGDYEYISCKPSLCPVDEGWSSWDSWGACNGTCGTGQQSRRRYCNNPAPANGGAYCQGEDYDNNSCTLFACAVNGGWSSWDSWGHCNVTNGTGQQSRRRNCNNPAPANDGDSCQGEEYDHNSCEEREQQSANISLAVGTVSGALFIVIVIILVVIYAKRRWYNSKKEPDYDITDITRVKSHIYEETHVNHMYQNDLQSAEREVTVTQKNRY
ncbi:HMCN [Mytilus coruscus]|uniref:HMCN n=1 Tax=Mytilus coruscus TaxID=42192 RepID=A0A6J8B408_MYTCO|nr:HMCN [Mytilus coruscus]